MAPGPVVLYTAAHGGFARHAVPLGGGAAVFEHLVAEWERTQPFQLRTITPDVLASGGHAPTGRELVNFGERAYARFSREFERASTAEILKHAPDECVVLVNDISEGPDFALLGARGYRIFTIYHVDVVAYVARMYLRGWASPESTVRWYRRLTGNPLTRWMAANMAALVWAKQAASVTHSRGLIVPSQGMRDVLLRCYPECPVERIHVLPWGSWPVDADDEDSDSAAAGAVELRREFAIPDDARVVLTLSRISPEKGQDRLLESLLAWERESDPGYPLYVVVCGDAAFMQGQRFLGRLRALADRLKRIRVLFPGYVTGARKRAFLELADVYVFPSRHESYGLTLVEALAAGLPAVCCDSLGAHSVLGSSGACGVIVGPEELAATVHELLADEGRRVKMREAGREYAARHRFSVQAAELARLLMGDRGRA